MKDNFMRISVLLFVILTVLFIGLAFAGLLAWVTTFFIVIMAGISLGIVGEYRGVL